ncbi:MAG: AMP-binding protein, partial [Deltaproteobacteria bacterium]|nr:AMP-binding protein [Deltaproteobacteria bacterium]
MFQASWTGYKVNFVERPDTLPQNLREVSPTIFGSVPRLWEKFASAIAIRMSDAPPVKRALYHLSVRVGLRYVRTKEKTRERLLWGFLYWPCYFAVLYHLKRQMGFERIRWAVCAAAPAAPELFEFYNALGVPLREAYGQTESTGVIALQRID